MKNHFVKSFIILFCFISLKSSAQYSKIIVEFKDKKNSPYSFSDPSKYLSKKAINRRTRYHIVIDSSDLPVNPSYISRVLKQGPVKYLSQSKWLNQILIYCTSNATINAIEALPFVKKVKPVAPGTANQFITANKFSKEKISSLNNLQNIQPRTSVTSIDYGSSYDQVHIHNGEFLHDKGFKGDGLTIAIIDAGFYHYKTTKAFDSARLTKHILGERDFVDFDNSVNEDDEHGENCFSTIASNVPGVMVGTAPHAKFWLLRSEDVYSEYPVEEQNWVAAAEFADSVGADMISSSLGYFQFDDASFNHTYADFYKNKTWVSKGATYAAKKGMIVTISAGNEGNTSWKYLLFPADDDSVCTVGAIDINKRIADFSSYGYPGRVKPNIVSVGESTAIYTPWGVSWGSGTSFSNPNINGLIACLWEAFPKLNNMTILNAVYQSSNRDSNPNQRYGYGIPDMRKAYHILKAQQNLQLYGSDWLFATLDKTNKIRVRLIGQVNDVTSLKLVSEQGVVLSNISMHTEKEEVYDEEFIAPQNGKYTVQYSDASVSRNLILDNKSANWLTAVPVPFQNELSVQLRSPENGNITLNLINAEGKVLESKRMNVVQNNFYNIQFNKAALLSKGMYYVQYKSDHQNKTIKVLK